MRKSVYRSRSQRGVTLIETMVTVMILTVAITSALEVTTTHRRSSRLAEERRIAQQTAIAKIDQLRVLVSNGFSLDGVFQSYGPINYEALGAVSPVIEGATGDVVTIGGANETGGAVDTSGDAIVVTADQLQSGGTYVTFAVGEDSNNNGRLDSPEDDNGNGILDTGEDGDGNGRLTSAEDLNENGVLDYYLTPIGNRPLGTVSIINSEVPRESNFGYLYGAAADEAFVSANWWETTPFGVDINGNRSYTDGIPPPFSNDNALNGMDINGNGRIDDDGGVATSYITENFAMLPVVITIQWMGPYGPERYDHFAIITDERK